MPAAAAAGAGRNQCRRTRTSRSGNPGPANTQRSELKSPLRKEAAVQIVVGPIVTRDGGFAFDSWTPERGLSRGYSYRRVEDAHYARKAEIRSCASARPMLACSTVDEFTSTLAGGARLEGLRPGL